MDIIVVRRRLPRLPEVVTLARLTGRSRHEVAGLMVDFWGWSLEAGRGGRVALPRPPGPEGEGVALSAVAEAVGADAAFWRAVAQVGWLRLSDAGLEVPNFDRWLGAEGVRKALRDAGGGRPAEGEGPRQGELFGHTPWQGKGAEGDELFERFWAAYPRKEAKVAARRAWNALRPGAPQLEEMLKAVAAQGLARREKKYTPLPATWLNGRRWEDDCSGQHPRGPYLSPPPGKYDGLGG